MQNRTGYAICTCIYILFIRHFTCLLVMHKFDEVVPCAILRSNVQFLNGCAKFLSSPDKRLGGFLKRSVLHLFATHKIEDKLSETTKWDRGTGPCATFAFANQGGRDRSLEKLGSKRRAYRVKSLAANEPKEC